MDIAVQLYGRLAALASRQVRVDVPLNGFTVSELRAILAERHPALGEAILPAQSRVFVDDQAVAETARPAPGQRVDFLPPVSGG